MKLHDFTKLVPIGTFLVHGLIKFKINWIHTKTNLDGASDDDYKPPAAKLRNSGIDVFAVGVGNSRESELIQIAGTPERVFKTRRFNDIAKFNQKLVAEICTATNEVCPDQELDLVFMLDSSGKAET